MKKVISLILVLAMVATLLVGCANTPTSSADTTAAQLTTAAAEPVSEQSTPDTTAAIPVDTELLEETESAEFPEETEAWAYTYEGDDDWDTDYGGVSFRLIYDMMASDDLDMDAFIHSPAGELAYSSMFKSILYYTDVMDERNVADWAERGMKKELHDAEDEAHQWLSFTPNSAYLEENADKTYPVLFVWHGDTNAIYLAEWYGFTEMCAEKEYICVIPWADNDDAYLEETDRILNVLREEYPIDETRIYSTGFSKGGRTTALLALEKSDIFAAATACGVMASGHFYTDETGTELPLTGHGPITEEDFNSADSTIPLLFISGDCDGYYAMPYNDEGKVNAVNAWLELNGLEIVQSLDNSLELLASGSDPVEQKIGLDFDETEILELDNVHLYVGRFLNEDGVCTLGFVSVENQPHWPSPSMADLSFAFFEQFAKDPATGETIHIG